MQFHGYGAFGSGKKYYGYNAESYNPVTGNQNLRNRQVNIRRQRFLTEDTFLGTKDNTLTLNRYIYGNGNPLKYKDSSGNIAWLAIAGIAAGVAALGAGIYTGVTTGSWEEGLKAGATVGLAVGVGVATVGLVTAGSVTVGAGVVAKGLLASTQVVTAAGAGTGAILATSAMAGTATYKAGQRFIQGKNVGLGEAVNSIASVGYAGYNLGNVISLGSTYINSKTGAIDNWIGSLDSSTNANNTYYYGDITKNAGYVNPYGTGGRLNQDMAGATANSMAGGCEKALVDYGGSNYNSNYKSFNNTETLNSHFQKHGQEIANVLDKSDYTLGDYLSDANYIINNGQYSSDLNGYVSFMKNDNYGFVGLDRNTGNITTFHIKKVSELIKKAPDLGFGR